MYVCMYVCMYDAGRKFVYVILHIYIYIYIHLYKYIYIGPRYEGSVLNVRVDACMRVFT